MASEGKTAIDYFNLSSDLIGSSPAVMSALALSLLYIGHIINQP
jgi:hypothetical protein